MNFFRRFKQRRARTRPPDRVKTGQQHLWTPLPSEGNHVRLLYLLPGTNSSQISCKLSIANLDTLAEPYIAVSYTWGPAYDHHDILLDGSTHPIRENLHDLLAAFRRTDRAMTLWIDALCIDQSSLKERNHQVGKISQIFSKAQRVYAWLGNTDTKLDKAFTWVEENAEAQRNRTWPLPADTAVRAAESISLIQGRTYWSRIWTVQELVLAQDVSFYCGKTSISWEDLLSATSMTMKENASAIREIAAMRDQWERSFEEVFTRFGYLQCALDHDKFYSLYGMVRGTPSLDKAFPLPDYDLCITEVFIQQLIRWEDGVTVKSPMGFVLSFIKQFSRDNDCRIPCKCHSTSIVRIRLPLHGRIEEAPPVKQAYPNHDTGRPRFRIHRANDIYRFRQFESAPGCNLKGGDLAFELRDPLWNLVVRYCDDGSQQDTGSHATMKVVCLVMHSDWGSRCFAPAQELKRLRTVSDCQLTEHSGVLEIQMKITLLTKLACFMKVPGSNKSRSGLLKRNRVRRRLSDGSTTAPLRHGLSF